MAARSALLIRPERFTRRSASPPRGAGVPAAAGEATDTAADAAREAADTAMEAVAAALGRCDHPGAALAALGEALSARLPWRRLSFLSLDPDGRAGARYALRGAAGEPVAVRAEPVSAADLSALLERVARGAPVVIRYPLAVAGVHAAVAVAVPRGGRLRGALFCGLASGADPDAAARLLRGAAALLGGTIDAVDPDGARSAVPDAVMRTLLSAALDAIDRGDLEVLLAAARVALDLPGLRFLPRAAGDGDDFALEIALARGLELAGAAVVPVYAGGDPVGALTVDGPVPPDRCGAVLAALADPVGRVVGQLARGGPDAPASAGG